MKLKFKYVLRVMKMYKSPRSYNINIELYLTR